MQIDDPYENYEGIGERFENDFVEYDLKFCIDIESLIKKHYPRYKDKKKISIFYNFGVGKYVMFTRYLEQIHIYILWL